VRVVAALLPVLFAGAVRAAEGTADRGSSRNFWGVSDDMAVARDGRVYHQVGTGFDRDLAPAKLIPDAAAPPKHASEGYPAGVKVRPSPLGLIYANGAGMSLYAMKVNRYRLRTSMAKFCTGPCAEIWTALAAPVDAKAVGAWHVVDGVEGPQWAYGEYPVFTSTGDKRPGEFRGHEFEDMFFAINYVPPVPQVTAPSGIAPLLVQHRSYVLADPQGRPLYAYASIKDCKSMCDQLVPFESGMASRNVGDWSVDRSADRAQWKYRGKLVFVAQTDNRSDILDPAAVVRP
jgi:predicted lipoprotein with Yx(FWY)xxD motif